MKEACLLQQWIAVRNPAEAELCPLHCNFQDFHRSNSVKLECLEWAQPEFVQDHHPVSCSLWVKADSALPLLIGSNRNEIAPHKCEARERHDSWFLGWWSLCSLRDAPLSYCSSSTDVEPVIVFWMAGMLRKIPWGYFYGIYWLFCCSADWFLHRLRQCFVDTVPWNKFIPSPIVWPVCWRHVQWTLVATAQALMNWMSVFWGSWQQLAHYLLC